MEYEIELTHQYLKDLKLARKRGFDENKLNEIIKSLANGVKLPPFNRDHNLSGNYKGYRECHITPDWLVIYSKKEKIRIITLIRTGSHSDLF